jgi:6-phosphogluconolactonase/glucosamine-6-phosphate isomerase/deaminase
MKFTTDSVEDAVQVVFEYIAQELRAGHHVLWLTSGGSCIAPQVEVMTQLREVLHDKIVYLTVLPVDERFGAIRHADSNTEQMRKAGFIAHSAAWHDVLSRNMPLQETVLYYSELTAEAFAEANVVVATLGMGTDGHTAGLLPGSPAVTDTVSTVVGYEWSDYTRMTLGVATLLKIPTAFLLAYGEGKKQALERLRQNDEPVEQLPAKILYDIADVTVYNDYIET